MTVAPASAAPAKASLKATLAVTVSDGYARLVFSSDQYIEATTKVAGHVLIITFKQPIDVAVDRAPELASDYIGAARRDPDGTAIRMALAQDVTVNAMDAGEKLFVDLLPSSWTGPPPALPQDVVTEIARRAREAERQLQRERELTQAKYVAPIRVHVASLPTFTRYVFDVTGTTAVAADRAKDRLVLNFNAPLTFDLADAQAALPNGVQAIDSEIDKDASLVRFVFSANLDLRTFRDESGYVVDVVKSDDPSAHAGASAPKSANGGPPSPEAAAAAVNAAASGQNAAPVEPPSPRRIGPSSALPNPAAYALAQGIVMPSAQPARRRRRRRLRWRSQRRPWRPRHLCRRYPCRRQWGRAVPRQCRSLPRQLRPFQPSNLPRRNPRRSNPRQKPHRSLRLRLLQPRKQLRHRNLSHRNPPHSMPPHLLSPLRRHNW
jgi:hypothetical protein